MPKLPDTVQEITEVIGQEMAARLIAEWPRTPCNGGTSSRAILYVPLTMRDSHRLVGIIGRPAADKLSARFGGELLFLPSCHRARVEYRRKAMIEHARAGLPVDRIALHFRVTERTVWRALSGDRAAMTRPANAADYSGMNTPGHLSA